jgi:histidinol-phosphate aminotransferase
VYVCNPNNPTGTTVATDQLAAFVRAVPGPVTVVVDEAYVDFTDVPGRSTAVGLLREAPNLVVLRTFSKLHGLAGLRVGYGVAPAPLATRLGALSLVWPNSTGIAAATASLNDRGFLQATRTAIVNDRTRVQGALDRLGRPRADSKGNFVFFDTGRPVAEFQERMLAQGLRVGRRFAGYDTWSRVTIGVRDEVDRFLAALPGALKA